ncbi:SGNH hydrolase [Nemania abortiva]|nr:SGNH hydrolase [Nemania abortiva]
MFVRAILVMTGLSGLVAVHASFEQQAVMVPKVPHVITSTGAEHQEKSVSSVLRQYLDGKCSDDTGFVAFGDSYGAGIGTGVENNENGCYQGSHAYSAMIAADCASGAFQLLSCTGARTTNIMIGGDEGQLERFNNTLPTDFAILTIGGHDLDFFQVINCCVFRFYMYGPSCRAALNAIHEKLGSDRFDRYLRVVVLEILDEIRWEKKPWFTVTVTGYARFFNEATDDCDKMNLGWGAPPLSKALRVEMNDLVLAVNAKIKKAVDAINDRYEMTRVIFVDYDDAFEGHRFCEPNVNEPDYLYDNDIWFFVSGGWDNGPDAARDHFQSMRWWIPSLLGRAFHPKTLGQEAIRNKIYEAWRKIAE